MRRVFWSKDARTDLRRIVKYFADKNPPAGLRVVERIEEAARLLWRLDTGAEGRMIGVREKRVRRTRYIIAYATRGLGRKERRIIILRVIHTSQNWTSQAWPDAG